jgi:hypothetical protein
VLDRRLAAPLATRLARVLSTQSIQNPLGFRIFHQAVDLDIVVKLVSLRSQKVQPVVAIVMQESGSS